MEKCKSCGIPLDDPEHDTLHQSEVMLRDAAVKVTSSRGVLILMSAACHILKNYPYREIHKIILESKKQMGIRGSTVEGKF